MFTTGLDEVGRGCFAGPLVGAVVNLKKGVRLPGLNDSKKVPATRRAILCGQIKEKCDFGVGIVPAKIVDEIGLIKATNLAFIIALSQLEMCPTLLLVDGRDKLILPYPHESIIKGDGKIRAIMAASIVAKVTRDKIMESECRNFPEYGFSRHVGYGTREHRTAIARFGLTPLHRRSFCH